MHFDSFQNGPDRLKAVVGRALRDTNEGRMPGQRPRPRPPHVRPVYLTMCDQCGEVWDYPNDEMYLHLLSTGHMG